MKHISFFLLILSSMFVCSCVDSSFSSGSSIIDGKVSNVIIDTCTVSLETALTDSTATSGISTIFMGKYNSTEFGNTDAESFISFSVPSYSSTEFNKESKIKTVIDSVCLVLKYNSFSYGDTTKQQTIKVTKLTDRLDELYTARSSAFYNNQTASSESSAFVTKKFYRPQQADQNDSILFVRLPDAFGQQLIDSMYNQSEIFNSETNFLEFFKGFKLSAGSDDQYCINSFQNTSGSLPTIRIFYHSYSNDISVKTLDITANSTYSFSHVSQDRSSTALKNLTSSNPISSSLTSNKAYLQGIVGLSTQLTFPYINVLEQLGSYVNVAAAYLYVYPVANSYNKFTPLPSTTKLNFVNKLGVVKDIYVESTTSVTAGALTEDQTNLGSYYYPFDITSFIKSEITAGGSSDKGTLQFQLSDTDKAKTLKSIIIGDSSYPDTQYQIKLVIQLLVYDND